MEMVCRGSDECLFKGACEAYARQLGQLSEYDVRDEVALGAYRVLRAVIVAQADTCPQIATPSVRRTPRHPIRGEQVWPTCVLPVDLRVQAQDILDGAHPYITCEVERRLALVRH